MGDPDRGAHSFTYDDDGHRLKDVSGVRTLVPYPDTSHDTYVALYLQTLISSPGRGGTCINDLEIL